MTLTLHPGAKADVEALQPPHRAAAVEALLAIRERPEAPYGLLVSLWTPREHAVGLDVLQGCLCARFSTEHRVVYQLSEDGALVLAVGPRFSSQVYRVAAERLAPRKIRRVRPDARRRRPAA